MLDADGKDIVRVEADGVAVQIGGKMQFFGGRAKAVEKLEQAYRAVMAMEGTLGADISDNMRALNSWMMTYQNFRLLSTTLFSSFADVVGLVVNGGELGDAWDHGRVHLTVQSTWNGRKVGMCDAGPEMTFHFGQLIAHIAKTRNVRAGSIVGSGTVSNKGVEQNGRMEWPKGYSCIAEKRCIETIQDGKPTTEFMKFGDTIRIEVKGKDGASIFGAIDQEIAAPGAAT